MQLSDICVLGSRPPALCKFLHNPMVPNESSLSLACILQGFSTREPLWPKSRRSARGCAFVVMDSVSHHNVGERINSSTRSHRPPIAKANSFSTNRREILCSRRSTTKRRYFVIPVAFDMVKKDTSFQSIVVVNRRLYSTIL